jgi:hypothetical protein
MGGESGDEQLVALSERMEAAGMLVMIDLEDNS